MIVKIKGISYPAEVLTSNEDIEKGMMFRSELNGCMVFKLKKGHHSFWMKNCYINLDIVFLINNKITTIHRNCPIAGNKINIPTYNGIGDTVIEFPANTSLGWNIGDKINIIDDL